MLEKKTVSQCVSADYCRRWNDAADSVPKRNSVKEVMPEQFVSVLGYMIDAGDFPPVRECYLIGNTFYFPALLERHPISHWMPLPEPPEE